MEQDASASLDHLVRAAPPDAGGPAVGRAVVGRTRAAAAFALAVAGLAAGLALTSAVLPPTARVDSPLRGRLDAFAAQKDEVDVLIVGSSRSFRGISPDVLDARLAERRPGRGVPLRSFNLGWSGLRPIEADALLRTALALRPARLRWVLVELADVRGDVPELGTWRSIGWHDLAATRRVVEATWDEPRTAAAAFDLTAQHLHDAANRALLVGTGPHAWTVLTGARDARRRQAQRAAEPGRGFVSLDADQRRADIRARRAEFLEDEAGDAPPPEPSPVARRPSAIESDAIRAQAAAVRAAGAEPVYVVLPQLDPTPAQVDVARSVAPVLRFDRPDAFPELFDTVHRFDAGHLSERGAELFSRLLADALADVVEAREAGEAGKANAGPGAARSAPR